MAAGILSKPGTQLGPCKEACNHKDCVLTRKMAESICRICNKPIGYEVQFYQEGKPSIYVHAACLHEEYERRTNA